MPSRQSRRFVAARHHPLPARQRLSYAVSVVQQRGLAVWQKGRCQPTKPLGVNSTAISIVRSFITSASQGIVSALERGHGRDASAPASSAVVSLTLPTALRAMVMATDTTACR